MILLQVIDFFINYSLSKEIKKWRWKHEKNNILLFFVICTALIASSKDGESTEIGIKYDLSSKNLFLNSKKMEKGTLKENEALIYSSNDLDKNEIIPQNKEENANEKIELLKLRNPKENDMKIYQNRK